MAARGSGKAVATCLLSERTIDPEAGDVVAARIVLGALGRSLVSSSCKLSDVSG